MTDNDCDNNDIRTNDYCKENMNTCLYLPKPCAEYGTMTSINLTDYNFPETVSWVIQNEGGIVILEGGPMNCRSIFTPWKNVLNMVCISSLTLDQIYLDISYAQ